MGTAQNTANECVPAINGHMQWTLHKKSLPKGKLLIGM
ncbi:Hypothetical protein I595_2423 [Croceitalea dokdonensis DOKDO 023]|uniref:Uncharacterized protein n=1 Tax=Croceitalea dokdonensis DOKDO 023 TaxID=1300341 RepID=A0A0P7A3Y6_9FLAO|nr:Hypothetical protein I595_2423 [Croceitalea dokdonensis DOKDO 023]